MVVFFGCDASAQTVERQANGGSPASSAPVSATNAAYESRHASVELRLASGHGLLFTDAVHINGERVGYFLVDTGSNITVIGSGVAEKMGITVSEASLSVGGRRVGGIANVQLSVGPLSMRKHPVGVMDLDPLQKFSKPVVGIFGTDVLGKVPFTVDYREGRLTLFDPSRFEPPVGAKRVELQIVMLQRGTGLASAKEAVGTPAVTGEINGHKLTLVLDTGLSRGVFIGRADAAKQPTKIGQPVPPLREASVVAGQESSMLAFSADELQVLGQRWRDLAFAMTPRPSASAEGTAKDESQISAVGGTLLREYRLTFDMPHRLLWVSHAPMPQVRATALEAKNFAGVPPVVEAVEYADVEMLKLLLCGAVAAVPQRVRIQYPTLGRHWWKWSMPEDAAVPGRVSEIE